MAAEPITWIAVAMAAISNVGAWLAIIRGKNGRADGGHLKPGLSQRCIDHGEKIVKVQTRQDRYDQDISEIKHDIGIIRQKVT